MFLIALYFDPFRSCSLPAHLQRPLANRRSLLRQPASLLSALNHSTLALNSPSGSELADVDRSLLRSTLRLTLGSPEPPCSLPAHLQRPLANRRSLLRQPASLLSALSHSTLALDSPELDKKYPDAQRLSGYSITLIDVNPSCLPNPKESSSPLSIRLSFDDPAAVYQRPRHPSSLWRRVPGTDSFPERRC